MECSEQGEYSDQEWMEITLARWALIHFQTMDLLSAWAKKMEKKKGVEWRNRFRKVISKQHHCRHTWMPDESKFYNNLENGNDRNIT